MLPPYWGIPKFPIALSWVPFMLSGEVTDKLFFSTTNRASEKKGIERSRQGRRKQRRWFCLCCCFIVEISASTIRPNSKGSDTKKAQTYSLSELERWLLKITSCLNSIAICECCSRNTEKIKFGSFFFFHVSGASEDFGRRRRVKKLKANGSIYILH